MKTEYPPEILTPEVLYPRSGNQVFWFQNGERCNTPCPALVNVDASSQRALSLTVFTVNGPMLKDGVKHIDSETSEIDRRDNGGWAWNRTKSEEKKK